MRHVLKYLALVVVCILIEGTCNAQQAQTIAIGLNYAPNQDFSQARNLSVTHAQKPHLYTTVGAPCRNPNGLDIVPCVLDTWALAPSKGYAYREVVTRNGRLWSWNVTSTGNYILINNGTVLTSVLAFMRSSWETGYGIGSIPGPCYGQKGTSCRFQELSYYTNERGLLRQTIVTMQPIASTFGTIKKRLFCYTQDTSLSRLLAYVATTEAVSEIEPTGSRPRL